MFRDPDGNQQVLAHLADLVGRGQLHPTVPTEFPLSDAARVMSDLIDRLLVGKAVLVP
jgi:NADPH:quinone reductase-like Zn-dependent oxidoreductase